MKRLAFSRNGWIEACVAAGLVLTLMFLVSSRTVVLNPDGYGAVILPVAGLAVMAFAGAAVLALRMTALPKGDVWILTAIAAPLAGLFGYALVTGGIPAVSLMVSARPITVEAQVVSSGTQLNTNACTSTIATKRTLAHVVRIEGQPPFLGELCLPSVRGRSGSGQLVLSPPAVPDPGPVLIEGQGNWFAVRVEGFGAL